MMIKKFKNYILNHQIMAAIITGLFGLLGIFFISRCTPSMSSTINTTNASKSPIVTSGNVIYNEIFHN